MDPRPPAVNLDLSQRMYMDPTKVNNIQWPSNFQFTRQLFDSNRLWNNPPIYQHPTPPPLHEQYTPVEVQYPYTTQTFHPSPTPRSNSTSAAPGGWPPNWTHKEDVALCKAWINVSTDAVVGTGKRKQTFWDRIHAEYVEQMPGTLRVAKGCENRWGMIYPEVSKWSASLTRMQRNVPSGFNQLDELRAAREFFHGEHKHYFKFEHCWEILRDFHKWQEFRDAREASRGRVSSRTPSHSIRTPSAGHAGTSQSDHDSVNLGDDNLDDSTHGPVPNTQPYQTPMSDTPPSFDTPNDSSPFDSGFRGSFERPIGRNVAKKQRQGIGGAKSDSSSVVRDKTAASIATIKERSQERWDTFKQRHEEESFYNITIKKLKLITQRAVIEESIIRSEKERISMIPTGLGAEAEIEKMVNDRKRELVELEAEAEELRTLTYSPGGTSRRASMDHGTARAACLMRKHESVKTGD